ncbi:hypothetical protein Corgl_1190 [Coriobacterium glomerans PW2]|uniref:Polysaccharide pyruvyl transferase domain-containing protein n=1 Tax=Coriobacterium glomerans (strain ATCC 49209 / DSM 20642 / JCM 10262 / PW2) TaxID=700015 RepID=F2N8B1_CORGP|nr:polysaccharide pyruvyl transferase family protein [Coriobacterium glomerans]AEB07294.1 hypothetical protein Corgl_1190 [Coriobacterium glomerans PW2]
MSSVGILTFQNTLNFGAVLQNYALYSIIASMGFIPTVINYRSKKIELAERLVFGETVKDNIKFLLSRTKAKKFEKFKSGMNFSEECDRQTIKDICAMFDYIVVGSDQVWNTIITGSDPTYFLDFLDDSSKRKTYAVSMGFCELPNDMPEFKKLVSGFSSLLVREKTCSDFLSRICPHAVSLQVVVDPTLLIDPESWTSMACLPQYAKKKDYILVYDISESETTFIAARLIAKQTKKQIIRIQQNTFGGKFLGKKGIKSVRNVSPEQYLGLFKNAALTVVSSFHGVCFSIINQRDFYFATQVGNSNTNSRIYDLLDSLGIKNRSVQHLFSGTAEPINWSVVDTHLATLRKRSLDLLESSLNDLGCKDDK